MERKSDNGRTDSKFFIVFVVISNWLSSARESCKKVSEPVPRKYLALAENFSVKTCPKQGKMIVFLQFLGNIKLIDLPILLIIIPSKIRGDRPWAHQNGTNSQEVLWMVHKMIKFFPFDSLCLTGPVVWSEYPLDLFRKCWN